MLRFFPGSEWFALGGLIAAAAPIVIHLLNRRRYRTIDWAAMDFLRAALRRNRRILEIRDLVLLVLRTLLLALFGLAMARPYFSSGGAVTGAREPVHAILLLDNSLSMGYQRLDGTLLDAAKRDAVKFVDDLPPGSRVSVLPLCGSAQPTSRDAYRDLDDARDAIIRLELVDRGAPLAQAVALAREAMAAAQDLPAKRCVLLGDQQRGNWPSDGLEELLAGVPDLQIVDVSESGATNSWVSDFRLRDDLADLETPAQFLATIRHSGSESRLAVPVTLTVDGVEVAAETVDLEPGQTREVRFSHTFGTSLDAGQVEFVSATVSLPPDRLVEDDVRHLAVPVVAALPIVFVDQYGEDEGLTRQRYGETLPLRRLLAPVTSRVESLRPLIQMKHVTIEQVTRDLLSTARLVVIAGVDGPGDAVQPLVEFIRQGGRVILAAGGEFDPVKWQSQGWNDGTGLLPLPLGAELTGRLPEEAAGELQPMFLDPATMAADEFFLDESARSELTDLYQTPLFFQAALTETGDELLDRIASEESLREAEQREESHRIDVRREELLATQARGRLTAGETAELEELNARRERITPRWLNYPVDDPTPPLVDATDAKSTSSNTANSGDARAPSQVDPRYRPRVLARLTGGTPILVQRRMGKGEVVWFSSGLQSSWNNLMRTNAVLLFDRLMRTRLAATLPKRSLDTRGEWRLPVAAADRRNEFSLTRPGGVQEILSVDAVGRDQYAVTPRHLFQRGIYVISSRERDDTAGSSSGTVAVESTASAQWQAKFVVNGPESESEISGLGPAEAEARLRGTTAVWLKDGATISLDGGRVSGQDFWKWLMAGVLVCLLGELAIIALPKWSARHGMTPAPVVGRGV